MRRNPTVPFSVRLPPEMRDRLDEAAGSLGISSSRFVLTALDDWIWRVLDRVPPLSADERREIASVKIVRT